MPLTLYVDGPRWRAHLAATAQVTPRLVPVAKGNGYGFTVGRLARRAEWLGADMIAVGSYGEVGAVEKRFSGDILVLEPWRPGRDDVSYADRVVHTVSRLEDLAALARHGQPARVVLEALTSMRRHGMPAPELARAVHGGRHIRVEGHALHLPLDGTHLTEVEHWLAVAPARRWFVSHLRNRELEQLRRRHADLDVRPRVGTRLWLGAPDALSARATVVDSHAVRRGDRVGYRQRKVSRDGTVLVVSGGTAHGIGLEAPTPGVTARQRVTAAARGGLDAAGRALSPYLLTGKKLWFVEPPHMQISMLMVPAGVAVPEVGAEIEVQVRHTTTTFDRVDVS